MSAVASSSSSSAASSSAAPAAQSQRIGIEQLLAARRASPAVRVVVDAPALSIGCAAVLALRAVAIGQPAALVGTRTLMGMFPVAFPYFALRELVVVPQLGGSVTSAEARHLGGVPQSALSGLLLGPVVSMYRSRGAMHGVPRAALTFAAAFGGGQLLLNEVMAASGWVYAKTRSESEQSEVSSGASPSGSVASAAAPSRPLAAPAQPDAMPAAPSPEAQHDEPWYSRASLSRLLPVRKISDDEYARKLGERERELEKRLAELHGELRASSVEERGAGAVKV